MGKLFGTDGIRGIAGQTLTAELAFHVGQAVAAVLTEKKGSRPLVTIGKPPTTPMPTTASRSLTGRATSCPTRWRSRWSV